MAGFRRLEGHVVVRRTRAHEEALAEAKRGRRAVQQKVHRVERATGAKITEYGYNPNTGIRPDQLASMSTLQLRKHIKQQREFLNRGNQFVAGDQGAPIQRSTWNRIVQAQEQINNRARQQELSYSSIEVPGTGMDIGGRLEATRAINKFRAGGQRKTFEEVNRKVSGLVGEEEARIIASNLESQLKGNYLSKRMKTARENLRVMLETTGDEEVLEKVNKLTNNQLNILIDYSYFLSAVGGRYDYQKSLNVAEQKKAENHWSYSVYTDNEERMNQLIDWAGTLPKSVSKNDANRPTDQRDAGLNSNTGSVGQGNDPHGISLYTDTSARPIPKQRPKRRKSK